MNPSVAVDPRQLVGTTLYLDCFAGIAGDMMLGALFDLGVPEEVVREALNRLPLGDYDLKVETVRKGALMARHVLVVDRTHRHHHHGDAPDAGHSHDGTDAHPHVHYEHIRQMIEGASGLDTHIMERALAMFERLAVVEAALHGVPLSEVAFHEVGALDSIVDIVGVAAALHFLSPRRVIARPVPLGTGTVRTAHGILPVPAPATLALLKNVPVEGGGPACELTTPTGATILAANVCDYGPLPTMRIVAIGHGAGTRELRDRPNLLRVMAGVEANPAVASPEGCLIIEANIDDMNPQLYEPLLAGLSEISVRDAWLTPVQMKKGRPGVMVSVLCDPQQKEAVATLLLRESTTLGIRTYPVERRVLDREIIQVMTEFGTITVKLGRDPLGGAVWNIAPEFSTCIKQARIHGVPPKTVVAAAIAACHKLRL